MIRQIRYFQTVVRCKSFTEAAEECHISQSAISQQLQSLEQELGTKEIGKYFVFVFSDLFCDCNQFLSGICFLESHLTMH